LQHRGYRINDPAVIYQLFDDEVVAIYLASGSYHSLPGIAGEAFLGFGVDGATVRDVAAHLAGKYDADPARIERDLVPFLAKLERELLVAPVENCPAKEVAPSGGSRIPYTAPDLQTHSDLQELFLIDPVHDVGEAGWPQPAPGTAEGTPPMVCRFAGPNVIFETMPDETVAMNLATGAYFGLTGSAEDVFLLLQHGPTIDEVLRAMEARYAAARTEMEPALRHYLEELTKVGLIVVEPPAPGRAPVSVSIERPGSNLPFPPMKLDSFQDIGGGPAEQQAMLDRGRVMVRRGDLFCAVVDGEGVVADRETGDYYRLNEPSCKVFQMLQGRAMTMPEITRELRKTYQSDERNLAAAVLILLKNLVQVKLVTYEPGDADPQAVETSGSASAGGNRPFPGFRCTIHKDLRELMSPFNQSEYRPSAKSGRRTGEQWFVRSLLEYFEESAEREGLGADHVLRAGGRTVTLRPTAAVASGFAGDLTMAVSHLKPTDSPAVGPDLTVHIWDASVPHSDSYFATTLERILGDWSAQCGPRGQINGLHGDRLAAIYHPGPDVLSVVDLESGQAFYLKRDKSPLPYWEIGSPFRYILHSWFGAQGLQFVHGGAVGTAGGGVLLAAKGGSGKSTTAMLCADDGMQYAGDDYCLVDPVSGFLHSLYNTGKLKGSEDLTRVPAVAGTSRNADSFENGGSGKGIYFMTETWPERVSSGFPLRAILIPAVTGGKDSRLERCSPADALFAILPSTVAQLPGATQSDCQRMVELVEKLPAYHLHLGSEVSQIPALIRQVLT